MSRRPGRSRRSISLASGGDPFVLLGADRAWRADDAIDNGSNTTSLANYLGSALSLPRLATGANVKATSAFLNNRYALSFPDTSRRGYGGVALYGAAPAALTVASVVRPILNNCGWFAVNTSGAAANTGQSQLMLAAASSRKLAVDAAGVVPNSTALVQVSVYTAAGVTDYSNTRTGVFTAQASALAGTTLLIGELATPGTFALAGLWATTGYWTRELSASEISRTLLLLGAQYGVTIA